MPLRDHFHPPLSDLRPWESFHATWASALADILNRGVLPSNFLALEQIHAGAAIEIDVATCDLPPATTAPMILPPVFPKGCTIEIVSTDGGRRLVAAIELVSPGNKDRAVKRRLFAAKCATYLARGVGLVIVDVVTNRQANLHDELMELLNQPTFRMPSAPAIYCAAYRPLRRDGVDVIETWPAPLVLGQPLPTVPLSLEAELCVAVDLEAAYLEASQRRRLDEVPE